MAGEFNGKVAVVTGGSRGIGLAIAHALLSRGAGVTIAGRDEASLRKAEQQLGGIPGSGGVLGARTDVSQYEQVERLMESTVTRFGGFDILVNNAGVGGFSNVAEQPLDEWRRIIDTNLTGAFYCSRAAIPHLRKRGGGWIINISSLAGKNAFPGGGAYCASKSGLNAFSEVLMQEVRYDDIRVSYVMPGSVRTGFSGHSIEPGTEWKLAADDVARVVVDLVSHDRRSLPSRVELRPSKPRK
jgi:NAD(P)-dependent dehydrogenase (short-subunit alcohol dehydrogenase family)